MTPYTILSVDDEMDVEEIVTSHFHRKIRRDEYRFLFAHTGKQGMHMLREHPEIDVILADINMPEMDGLTMLETINRESYIGQPFQFVRTIIVTAYGDMPNIRKAMNHGAFDFLTKPLDLEDLETTVERAIQDSERVRQLELRRQEAEHHLNNANFLLDSNLAGLV